MSTKYATKFIQEGVCPHCGQPYGHEELLDGTPVTNVSYCLCNQPETVRKSSHRRSRKHTAA